jgi:predicted O-linked N-acetylglucosamine transferase (SPINDLY family)
LTHHRAGRFDEAQRVYREILQTDPRQPDALHLWGVLAHQTGRHEAALDLLQQAILAQPGQAAFHCDLGLVHRARRELQEAVSAYRRALEIDPDYADAHYNLGNVLLQQGQTDEAAACYRRAIRANPAHPQANNNLGDLLQRQGMLDEALLHCRRATEAAPDLVEAQYNLGRILRKQGQLDEAAACFRRVLALRPDSFDVQTDLAAVYFQKGELAGASDAFRRALAIRPDSAQACYNLATVLSQQGESEEAAACYQRAVEIQADFFEAQVNLGSALYDRRQLAEAIDCFRQAVRLKPDSVEVHCNLGVALRDQGQLDEAAAAYRRAAQIAPDQPLLQLQSTALCPAVFENTGQIDEFRQRLLENWQRFARTDFQVDPARLAIFAGEPPFGLAYHGRNDRELKEVYAGIFGGRIQSLRPTPGDGIPRIGFVATGGHEVGLMRFMGGIIRGLDRDQFEVEIVCSQAGAAKIRAEMNADAVHVQPIPRGLDRAAKVIRERRYDLLYFWEVGTDPVNYFLPFFRLAPVQCTSWGMPVTTGIPQMDYFISSELLEPEDAPDHYTEQLVRFGTLPTCYPRPALPGRSTDRARGGLSHGRHIYLCPQSLLKMHPDFDAALAEILGRDPAGEVVLLEGRHPRETGLLKRRLERMLPACAQRVRFVPRRSRAEFLDLLAAADVLLDPFHFGGGNTTYEALALGIPVVTWPSLFMRGRATYACYRKMGLADCVAEDRGDYAELAVKLATDRDYRRAVGARIQRASELLFGDNEAVGAFQTFFQEAVARAGSGRVGGGANQTPSIETLHPEAIVAEPHVDRIERAVRFKPEEAEFHFEQGIASQARGDLDQAAGAYRRALRVRPDFAKAHYRLGRVFRDQGRFQEAAVCFRRALDAQPDFLEACLHLGAVLYDQGHLDQSVDCLRRAARRQPDRADIQSTLGKIFRDRKKLQEAAECYRRAAQIEPDRLELQMELNTIDPIVFGNSDQIDEYRRGLMACWKKLAEPGHRAALAEKSACWTPPPFGLPYHGLNDRQMKEAYAGIFKGHFEERRPVRRTGIPRIGFVVTGGQEDGLLKFMGGIIERLPSHRFEVVILCSRPGGVMLRSKLKTESVAIQGMPMRLDQVEEVIRARHFDLLYYWEVGTCPINYFLPFSRPAPVQCTSWGMAVTTGIPQMDYFLSSELLETDDAPAHYSEQLVRFDTLPAYCDRPDRRPRPADRERWGHSSDRHIYLCPHNLRKIHPDFDPALGEILRRDPAGEVVLLERQHAAEIELLRNRFRATIPDCVERIRFLPRQNHDDFLDLLAASDVLLDPFHFGGGTTSYEAMALGIPVVTWPSAFMRGRATYACYRKMGITDCVAKDRGHYAELAVELGTDREYRRAIGSRIQSASEAIFCDDGAVCAFQNFFQETVEKARAAGR